MLRGLNEGNVQDDFSYLGHDRIGQLHVSRLPFRHISSSTLYSIEMGFITG